MRGLQTPSVVRSFSDLPGTHEDFVPRTGTSDDSVSSPGPIAASAAERGGGAPRAASTPSAVVVIPARYGSSRLPAKALADIGGKPMVVRVLECARSARGVKRVLVATDDHQIQRAVTQAGGEAVLTSADHPSGTDRIAEVARRLDDDVIVNVQGDLPFLDPGYVEAALEALGRPAVGGESAPVATLATPLLEGEAARSQVVKVVCDRHGRALYFSRSMIPSGGPRACGTSGCTRIGGSSFWSWPEWSPRRSRSARSSSSYGCWRTATEFRWLRWKRRSR